jgi:hypothetical protein
MRRRAARWFQATSLALVVGLGACAESHGDAPASAAEPKASPGDDRQAAATKIADDTTETRLEVADGALQGTAVAVPAGGLPVGSQLAISTTATPEVFTGAEGVTPLADPVSIVATGADGQPVIDLDQPDVILLEVV